MKDLFQQIGDRFRRDRPELPDDVIEGFLRVLEQARIDDMSCERVFERLDEYVEKEVHGQDAGQLMPLLREHFDLCPECCEEYEALLSALAKTAAEEK